MITGETNIVGLIGNPVSHSLSPIMHNAAIAEMGLNWCYIAIPCSTERLGQIVKALGHINCLGLNITIPHKQEIIKFCSETTPLAKKLGAVNTLIPNKSNNWVGTNTDVEGFLAPIRNKDLKDKKAILLGCGGSARAVISGLKLLKLKEIIIINHREITLKKFLSDFKVNHYEDKETNPIINGLLENDETIIEHIKDSDLIINTTPIGMENMKNKGISNSTDMPLGENIWSNLKNSAIVYDLIYRPKPTAWLKNAKKFSSLQIDGLEMLIHQGAASLRLWSGIEDIPINIMRDAAQNHLLN